jgi:transcription elongation factor Elf1
LKPLSIPGRVLVGEGILTKSCRKKLKPRQVFLFSDILVYGSVIINKKKYNRQHIIPLENVKLENLTDDNDLKYGWLIKTPNKSFAVYAATATEKVEWMAHINKCIEELLMRTGSQPASEHAAVWVPDNASPTCMACKKNFTVLNRRHHCRNCGVVVCGSCSKNRFLLPNQSSKPVRVCNACFETLGKSRTSFKENANDSQFGIKETETAAIKSTILNESSESEDEDDRKHKQSDDELTQSLEDLTIDEKPTFYSSINNTEVKRIGGQE